MHTASAETELRSRRRSKSRNGIALGMICLSVGCAQDTAKPPLIVGELREVLTRGSLDVAAGTMSLSRQIYLVTDDVAYQIECTPTTVFRLDRSPSVYSRPLKFNERRVPNPDMVEISEGERKRKFWSGAKYAARGVVAETQRRHGGLPVKRLTAEYLEILESPR